MFYSQDSLVLLCEDTDTVNSYSSRKYPPLPCSLGAARATGIWLEGDEGGGRERKRERERERERERGRGYVME